MFDALKTPGYGPVGFGGSPNAPDAGVAATLKA